MYFQGAQSSSRGAHLVGCDPIGVVDDSNQLGYTANNKAETKLHFKKQFELWYRQ